jgi:uncharacterized alpha/beta hydrolase family protein
MKKLFLALLIVLFSVTMAFAKVNINTATAREQVTRAARGAAGAAHETEGILA